MTDKRKNLQGVRVGEESLIWKIETSFKKQNEQITDQAECANSQHAVIL